MAQASAIAENLVRAFITASELGLTSWAKGQDKPVILPIAANTSIFRTTSK